MENKQYTIKELRALCQGIGAGGDAQTVFGRSNRLVSIYLTKFLLKTTLTPNWITVAGTIVYLFGIAAFIFGTWTGALIGFLLLVFAGILDACDGEVARFRKTKGYGGSFVEPISHDIMYGLTFLPVAFGAFVQTGNPYIFLFGASATIFKLLYRLGDARYLAGVLRPSAEKNHSAAPKVLKKFKDHSRITKIIYVLYRHTATSTGILPPLLIAGLFERLDIYVIFYGVYFLLLWLAQFTKHIYRFRKLLRQESAEAGS